jgi:hypothetical protein
MIRVHIRVLSEGAVNVHIAKRDTPASVLNEKDRSNVGMHDRRARIEVTKACMITAYIHICQEGTNNVHNAERCTPTSVHNKSVRCNVGMHDGRARIEVTKECKIKEGARNLHIAISMHDKSAYSCRCMEGASNVVHVH